MQVRILHVVGDSSFGGASFGIMRLAKFWQSLNWDVEVLATDCEFSRIAQSEGVKVVPFDAIWREIRPLRDLVGLLRLVRFLRLHSYTVVHTHTTKAGFVGRLAAWLAGVPIVIHTAHGFAFHESSPRLKILFYTFLERVASWACSRVITVSRFHQEWGCRLGIASSRKIVAIPNGIPDSRVTNPEIRMRIRAALGAGDRLVLLTPGRLAPEKGLEDLLEAFSVLQPQMQRMLFLVIAGEGILRKSLDRMIEERNLRQHVRLLGFQTNVGELLSAADIVILPTWREGLSIALLEAMAQGTAIITTTIGSNIEATNSGGAAHLIPPKRPELLAAAVEQLATDPERRRILGNESRRVFEERYSNDHMLAGYHQLYLDLLQEFDSANPVSTLLPSSDR